MKQERTGRFIAVEGIDGSGKSTQIKMLCRRMIALGLPAVSTFEPTDGPIGSLIRQMLAGTVPVDQRAIALLFAADRTDHLVKPETGVCHLLAQGKIVVSDRYYFSSFAYHARYMDWVIQANQINADILRPCATLFIDVAPETCIQRIQARGGSLEMYEKLDIMRAVRASYFEAFERLRDRETVQVIDGNGSPEDVAERIWEKTAPLI